MVRRPRTDKGSVADHQPDGQMIWGELLQTRLERQQMLSRGMPKQCSLSWFMRYLKPGGHKSPKSFTLDIVKSTTYYCQDT